ncbi:MAG: hypothetical protein OIF56_12445 [Cohaesibacter sp.]|nr:hypothetical protein [Cohaesibacter sp.]MCV6602624.1 hypothetical protein [Cohaesibacter sp.]
MLQEILLCIQEVDKITKTRILVRMQDAISQMPTDMALCQEDQMAVGDIKFPA